MGFISWRNKKEKQEENPALSLSVLSGQPVQVRTPEGAYLFNAFVQPVARDAAYLRWYDGIDPETLRAQMPETFQASLRFCQKETSRIIHAVGLVRQTGPQTWAMARIALSAEESDRKDFRQPITFWGRAVFPNQNGMSFPFQTTDISVHGIGLLIPQPCMRDEKFLAEAPFLFQTGITSLSCLVRYTVRVSAGSYHCGCKFIDMDSGTERALTKLIFQTQSRGDTFVE